MLAPRHPDIKTWGDPILKTLTRPIDTFDNVPAKVEHMERVVQEAEGMGLAAPQLGDLSRMCIVRRSNTWVCLINPLILDMSQEVTVASEGCLSLPGIEVDVSRSVTVEVEYNDSQGCSCREVFADFEARIVQHEIDHLEGMLILDRCPPEQKRSAIYALLNDQVYSTRLS